MVAHETVQSVREVIRETVETPKTARKTTSEEQEALTTEAV